MLGNFIYAQRKSLFEEKLSEVRNDAIAFIEDTREIWNHGHYYGTKLTNISELTNDANFQNAEQVTAAINSAISSAIMNALNTAV